MKQTKIIEFGDLEIRCIIEDGTTTLLFKDNTENGFKQKLTLEGARILVDWFHKEVLDTGPKAITTAVQKQEPQPAQVKAPEGPSFVDLDTRKAVVKESKPTQFVGRESEGDIETFDRGAALKNQIAVQ
jgi:hypothetical protein